MSRTFKAPNATGFRRTAARTAAVALLAAAFAVLPSAAQEGAPANGTWELRSAVTRIRFHPHLADLGLRIESGAQVSPDGWLLFAGATGKDDGPGLLLPATWGAFERFAGGVLAHDGGWTVRRGGRSVEVRLRLEPGRRARTLEIRDGEDVLFVVDMMQPRLTPERGLFTMSNADLRIGEGLARRFDEPRLAGQPVGVVESTARFEVPDDFEARLAVLRKSCEEPNFDPATTDVALIEMDGVFQHLRSGGKVAIAPSARLKNVGVSDVPWIAAFEPGSNHPMLVWALYRLDERLEMLGASSAKHAFATANEGCADETCDYGGHILGRECEDYYGFNTNADRKHLGPRDEIEAFAVTWSDFGSHFDGEPPDGVRSHDRAGHDTFEHHLAVDETLLTTPGARYFLEAWYLVRHDVDLWNSMGYREILPTFDVFWTFPLVSPFIPGPVIDAWVDPAAPGVGEASELVDTGQGHLKLAVRTTDLGGGAWRYDYALANFDLDSRIAAFRLPVAVPERVESTELAGVGNLATTDWTVSTAGGGLTWQSPDPASELDWGLLYRFSLVASAPPAEVEATLTAGDSTAIPVPILGPALTAGIFSDGFESGSASAWSASLP